MANRPPQAAETADLLAEIQKKQKRQKRLHLALALTVGIVLAGLLGTAAVAILSTRLGGAPALEPAVGFLSTTTSRLPGTTAPPPPRPSTTLEPDQGVLEPSGTTTTGAAPTLTTAPPPAAPAARGVIVIDPGHQARGSNEPEPIGPGSSQTKARVTSGTKGVATGIPEHELVLAVGLKLRTALEAKGFKVIMTRTTAAVDLSNIERTEIANSARADLYLRVHADGSPNGSRARGIHVLYPASVRGWTDDIAAPSKRAAELAQSSLIAKTQAPDLGIDPRDDMTGFNWSDVPVIIPEIGFMTNPEEDRLLATDAYRQKIAEALAEAAATFVEERRKSR